MQREGLRDKVLRIYFDQPCGNKFISNFYSTTSNLNFKYMWAMPLLKAKKGYGLLDIHTSHLPIF